MNACIYLYMHTCIGRITNTFAKAGRWRHAATYLHTYIHAYIHTYIGGIINTFAKAGRWKDAVAVLTSMTGLCVCMYVCVCVCVCYGCYGCVDMYVCMYK
jgi:pentatricopeptide repeat protein